MSKQLEQFLRGYAECAAWADLLRPGSDEAGSEGYGLDDFSADAVERMRAECSEFLADNASDLEQYCEQVYAPEGMAMEYAGHDFWLTRNRHGAGFWDRGLGDLGERLADAARVYGEGGMPQLIGDVIEI